MTKLGNNDAEVLSSIEQTAAADLSKLLETDVLVKLYPTHVIINAPSQDINNEYFDKFITLEGNCLIDGIAKYQESPELLKKLPVGESIVRHYHSSLLKSNCRVTSQPDFGDVFISFKSKSSDLPFAYEVSRESLLKYIISFRDECHFHEEICETIYTRLWNMGVFEELSVMCLYTRRGGIDICPERASNEKLLHSTLSNPEFFHIKTPRQ
jgi:7-cyano-7-deazaguanine reductase